MRALRYFAAFILIVLCIIFIYGFVTAFYGGVATYALDRGDEFNKVNHLTYQKAYEDRKSGV